MKIRLSPAFLSLAVLLHAGVGAAATDARTFAAEAATGGLLEVRLGEFVKESAGNERVRDFGLHMAADHGKANQELEAAAREAGLTLPTELGPKQVETLTRIRALSGPALDRTYMDEMVKAHEKNVVAFGEAAKGDGPVASWAARTLPTVERHLKEARSIESELRSTTTP